MGCPADPDASAATREPSRATTRAVPLEEEAGTTVTEIVPAAASDPISRSLMRWAGTGSSHTVCQIPLTAVYQMLFDCSTCLPRGCGPLSVGSQTLTTSSWSPP